MEITRTSPHKNIDEVIPFAHLNEFQVVPVKKPELKSGPDTHEHHEADNDEDLYHPKGSAGPHEGHRTTCHDEPHRCQGPLLRPSEIEHSHATGRTARAEAVDYDIGWTLDIASDPGDH